MFSLLKVDNMFKTLTFLFPLVIKVLIYLNWNWCYWFYLNLIENRKYLDLDLLEKKRNVKFWCVSLISLLVIWIFLIFQITSNYLSAVCYCLYYDTSCISLHSIGTNEIIVFKYWQIVLLYFWLLILLL